MVILSLQIVLSSSHAIRSSPRGTRKRCEGLTTMSTSTAEQPKGLGGKDGQSGGEEGGDGGGGNSGGGD